MVPASFCFDDVRLIVLCEDMALGRVVSQPSMLLTASWRRFAAFDVGFAPAVDQRNLPSGHCALLLCRENPLKLVRLCQLGISTSANCVCLGCLG